MFAHTSTQVSLIAKLKSTEKKVIQPKDIGFGLSILYIVTLTIEIQ